MLEKINNLKGINKLTIHNLKYIHSAHFIDDLPQDTGFEIAFAGRSNAGKSSV